MVKRQLAKLKSRVRLSYIAPRAMWTEWGLVNLLIGFACSRVPNATHIETAVQTWWMSSSGLRPRIVVPLFVGSNPIIHPASLSCLHVAKLFKLKDNKIIEGSYLNMAYIY